MRLKRGFRKDERGIAAIEFALIGPLVLLLMIGVFEVAIMLLAQGALDKAAVKGAHFLRSGQALSGSVDLEQGFADLACGADAPGGARHAAFFDCNNGLQVYVLAFNNLAEVSRPGAGEPGDTGEVENPQRGQFVVVQLYYDWQFYTPMLNSLMNSTGGRALLRSSATFRMDD